MVVLREEKAPKESDEHGEKVVAVKGGVGGFEWREGR